MEMKYCQGPKCHERRTKDRIRGMKGDKHYETRKGTSFYYLGGNACSMRCQDDWVNKFGEMAVNHFGRIHEPKRTGCDSAWYKSYDYNGQYSFINDLLGQRISITEQQYNNTAIDNPTHLD